MFQEIAVAKKARIKRAGTRKVVGKPSSRAVKTTKPKKVKFTKEAKNSTAHQEQDDTTDSEESRAAQSDSDSEQNEGGDPLAGQIHFEGDPGFEAAFQASRRRLRPAQTIRPIDQRAHRRRSRRLPSSTLSVVREISEGVSDAELLGDYDEPTSVAPSPILGRRSQVGSESSRVAPTTSARTTKDNDGPAVSNATSQSNAARLGLPVAPAGRPPQHIYVPLPDGSHKHYIDDSGTPSYVTRPEPSPNPRIGFTPTQRAENRAYKNAQRNAQPVDPSPPIGLTCRATDTDTTRRATRTPTLAPTGRGSPMANDQTTRLTMEIARHSEAIFGEIHRRQRMAREELGRHTREVWDILREGSPGYGGGYVEREDERERRELLPSSDDD